MDLHYKLIRGEEKKNEKEKEKFSLYKLKNIYADKLQMIIKHREEENKSEVEKPENKYALMVEKLFKQRQDEEAKEEQSRDRLERIYNIYSKEEIIEFMKEDPKILSKITSEKGEVFKNSLKFEDDLIKFFISSCNNINDFERIKNKDFLMSFRREKKGVTIKFEKEMDINVIHLLSLIYEVDYYPKWFPFCSKCEAIAQTGKAKKLIYMIGNFPVISDRDFLLYGFGVNRIKENNSILLLCKSVDENSGIFKELFKKKQNKKYVRAEIVVFGFEIKIINKKRILVRGLVNVDPKIGFIPQFLINTVSEKFAGDLFSKLLQISKNFVGSEYQNQNPSKVDKMFYDFLEEEIKNVEEGSQSLIN